MIEASVPGQSFSGAGTQSHSLSIRALRKVYGDLAAVDDVSFEVERGKFLTLLGPSGSGKTTILMSIAGFVQPTSGSILLDDKDITALPPDKRNFGMVFQGYALFPHMSVEDNIWFPLRVRGVKRADAHKSVMASLELVQMAHLAKRLPTQLSGGQQQRVALARALVFQPDLLLLDERPATRFVADFLGKSNFIKGTVAGTETASFTYSAGGHALEQAARSLGASMPETIRLVIMPRIVPGMLSGAIFAFTISFDEIVMVLFLTSRGIYTLPKRIWDGIENHLDPTIAAVATLLIIVTLALLLLELWSRQRRARRLKALASEGGE